MELQSVNLPSTTRRNVAIVLLCATCVLVYVAGIAAYVLWFAWKMFWGLTAV